MRIYDGSPRQDFEEVFRSIGAFLDSQNMKDVLLVEVPDGFVVQGLVTQQADASGWTEVLATVSKETYSFLDDDIAKFMEECVGRRGTGAIAAMSPGYERAMRVLGRWMDTQKPKDVFILEQGGSYVVRLLMTGQAGVSHLLAEFTHDDIEQMIVQGPAYRAKVIGA